MLFLNLMVVKLQLIGIYTTSPKSDKKQAMKKNSKLPALEKRHQTRYQILVESHIKTSQGLAMASQAKLGTASSFAATQAAWRFYVHEKTTLSKLSEPLVSASCESVTAYCTDYALIVHDWSVLNYWNHDSKPDRKGFHGTACGDELQHALY
jgi:hypothetical protein